MRRIGRWWLVVLLGAALAPWMGCAPAQPSPPSQRLAVPPEMLSVFRGAPVQPAPLPAYVSMRPYDRARDLEVLFFSSGSPVFSGILVPGRWVPLLRPWLQPLGALDLKGVREDVRASLECPKGFLAVPVTLDGPVMVYRRDWWSALHLPPPESLASLRDGLLTVRSRHGGLGRPVVSDLPEDQLFWGLAWSFEGKASPTLYSYPKVHALRFMQEFDLERPSAAEPSPEALLLSGRAAVLFTTSGSAEALVREGRGRGVGLAVSRLPAMGPKALAIFTGWCLVAAGAARDTAGWQAFLSPAFQGYLEGKGWLPVLASPEAAASGSQRALDQSEFHAPPALGQQGDEIVQGALMDVLEGAISPEEALRRAQARVQAGSAP